MAHVSIVRRVIRIAADIIGRGVSRLRRRVRPGDYVGLDHPTGELRLALRRGGRFRLSLAIWDPVVQGIAGRRELVGRWRVHGTTLELAAPARRLMYRAVEGGDLEWYKSSLPTFADGISLQRSRRRR